jgi:hypothetical protein
MIAARTFPSPPVPRGFIALAERSVSPHAGKLQDRIVLRATLSHGHSRSDSVPLRNRSNTALRRTRFTVARPARVAVP